MMAKQDKYRIVSDTEGRFRVEAIKDEGNFCYWIIVYPCQSKNEEGYREAKKWIEKQEE